MKTLIIATITLAIGLMAGAMLFSDTPPVSVAGTAATQESPAPTGAEAKAGTSHIKTATTTPIPTATTTDPIEQDKLAALAQTEAEQIAAELVEAVQASDKSNAHAAAGTDAANIKAQVCAANLTPDSCELSNATDFGALLLNGDGSVNDKAVLAILDADNFEVFREWLTYAERGELATERENVLDTNLKEFTNTVPDFNFDKPRCSDRICTFAIRAQSTKTLDYLDFSGLFQGSNLNSLYATTTTPGMLRYIAFRTEFSRKNVHAETSTIKRVRP